MGYLHSSICNISLQNIFNYKRKRTNFIVEKPGRVHLIKWSMLISPVMGQEEMMCNLTETTKRTQHHFSGVPTEDAHHESTD